MSKSEKGDVDLDVENKEDDDPEDKDGEETGPVDKEEGEDVERHVTGQLWT